MAEKTLVERFTSENIHCGPYMQRHLLVESCWDVIAGETKTPGRMGNPSKGSGPVPGKNDTQVSFC
jgi:hypothetical protein